MRRAPLALALLSLAAMPQEARGDGATDPVPLTCRGTSAEETLAERGAAAFAPAAANDARAQREGARRLVLAGPAGARRASELLARGGARDAARLWLLTVLAGSPRGEVEAFLLAAARTEDRFEPRALAADALARVRTPAALAEIVRLAADPIPAVRASALRSLFTLDTDEARKARAGLPRDPDVRIHGMRLHAASAAGRRRPQPAPARGADVLLRGAREHADRGGAAAGLARPRRGRPRAAVGGPRAVGPAPGRVADARRPGRSRRRLRPRRAASRRRGGAPRRAAGCGGVGPGTPGAPLVRRAPRGPPPPRRGPRRGRRSPRPAHGDAPGRGGRGRAAGGLGPRGERVRGAAGRLPPAAHDGSGAGAPRAPLARAPGRRWRRTCSTPWSPRSARSGASATWPWRAPCSIARARPGCAWTRCWPNATSPGTWPARCCPTPSTTPTTPSRRRPRRPSRTGRSRRPAAASPTSCSTARGARSSGRPSRTWPRRWTSSRGPCSSAPCARARTSSAPP